MMRNLRTLRWLALPAFALGLLSFQTETASTAPMRQTNTITAAGFVDVFPATDPNCPGCNLQFEAEDQTRAETDPLPAMEFVVRNGAGQELGRMTTQLFLGVQRAQFDVPPDEELYVVELVTDPGGWQLCPNAANPRVRNITQADFRFGSVTARYFFTQGCTIGGQTPVPTLPGPTATLRPGETPPPTAVPTEEDDEEEAPRHDEGGPFGQIRGVAFIDHNQDGKISAGEPGLNDVKVNLGGGGLEVFQITPHDGTYNFPGLGVGKFDVFIDPGPEWRVTTPKKYTVPVNGNDVAGIDFGLARVDAPAPADVAAAAAPRTGRRLVIPAPGAGIRLPSTGIGALAQPPVLGMLAAVLGGLAAVGFAAERRSRRE